MTSCQSVTNKINEKTTQEQKELIQYTCKMITILQTIHNIGVIHRDIKPQNFMMKNEEIFLIDFGLSTIFVDEDLKHIEPNNESTFIIGTPKFISLHIHNGKDASRRDDIISLMYLYIYMINDLSLPWENVKHIDKNTHKPELARAGI